MNKVVPNLDEAVAGISDGATILVGGFIGSGTPHSLMDGLIRRGVRHLTIVANGGPEWWPMVEKGLVDRLISPFPIYRRRPISTSVVADFMAKGKLRVETVPAGILEERLRAGGCGIGGFYRLAAEGTEFDAGKEKRTIGGKSYVLEEAIHADFALIKGWKADRWGNVVCRLAAGNRNIVMAQSAGAAIVEVEQIADLGDLDPNRIDIPGVYVNRVVKAPRVVKWAMDEPGNVEKNRRDPQPVLGLTRELIALRASRELRDGMHVNLGIGLPVLVCNFIPGGIDVILHSEQGVMGYGSEAVEEQQWDYDLVNASGRPITLRPGASCFDFAMSFGMTRGGKLDMSILGAFQVSERGDLANWKRPGEDVGGVGGAMELAMGARRVIATLEHANADGTPRIVRECSLPLTAPRVVHRIITNLAVMDVTPEGLVLEEIAPGITIQQVQAVTEPRLIISPGLCEMDL